MMTYFRAFSLHRGFTKKAAVLTGAAAIMILLIVAVTRIRAAALKQGRGVAPVTIRGAVLSETKTASPSGEVAGASTNTHTTKSIPFAQSLLNRPIVQTQLAQQPTQQVQYVYVPVSSGTSSSPTNTPTATSAPAQISAVATSTATPTPQSALPSGTAATSTPVPQATQGQPTATSTRIPTPTWIFIPTVAVQPTSTPQPATPTQSQPSFSASMGTQVSGDSVNVNVSANKELFICVFTFYKGSTPDIKQSSPGGNSCSSSSGSVGEITKIDVRVESKAHEGANLSKSSPFN